MKPVRQAAVLCMAAALAGSLGAQSKRPMTFMDIMDLKNVGNVALSPDGGTVAYTVATWDHPNAKPAPNPSAARHGQRRQARRAFAHLARRRERRHTAPDHLQRAR